MQRLEQLEQGYTSWDTEVEEDNSTSWLRHTQWPQQFSGLPIDIIATSLQQPEVCPVKDKLLDHWAGEAFLSPCKDEFNLWQITSLLELVLSAASAL
jgi:hypothetical protein